MTDPGMKCSRCKQPANHRMPSHNARFCDACLDLFVRRQAEKAIKGFNMLAPGQPVLVAVSGGKDSLALWKVLRDMGYQAEGLHLSLGLADGQFSKASLESSQAMADKLNAPLHLYYIEDLTGHPVEDVARANRRNFCSVCGTLKRYYLNRTCLELGFDTLAMGQHLDDEAARLLGNMIHRHEHYLESQWPVLPGVAGAFAKKIKPLCRLRSAELKAYSWTHGLPVARGSCPRSKGATLPFYTEAVQLLESRMPGTLLNFYLGFLKEKGGPPPAPDMAKTCEVCGAPTYAEVCTTCRFLERTAQRKNERRHAPESAG